MNVVKAPCPIINAYFPRLFLAGSIEMGAAEDWQTRLTEELFGVPGTIFNPRRDDWDSSWVQEIGNEPFREQVEWELEAMDAADLIALYLSPGTKSPITLLELGLHAKSGKLYVFCPEGFWRKGNVDIVCDRYSWYIQKVETWAEFVSGLKVRLGYIRSINALAKKVSTE